MKITKAWLESKCASPHGIEYFESLKTEDLTEILSILIRDGEQGYYEWLLRNTSGELK